MLASLGTCATATAQREHRAVPGFGELASVELDRSYRMADRGFLFTSPWVVTRTRRPLVTVLVSASARSFELRDSQRTLRGEAMLVPPLQPRFLDARDVALVSVNLTPHHPAFARLAQARRAQLLPWSAFEPCIADMLATYAGERSHDEVARLLDRAVEATLGAVTLPRPDPYHALAPALIERIASAEIPTLAMLAELLGVCEDRASRIAGRALGLPFKSYIAWRKLLLAWDHLFTGMSLTEIAMLAGYTDLAHFTRTFVEQYGASPSWFRDARHVQMFV